MIKRLLIANRGEIASRIIRSCNALGIETISVFAASDRHARYVEESNYSVEFPRQAGENPYVSQEHILEIAQSNRACAIHPGYGFLSENADFAEAVREAGIIFIGPKADTIRSIGDKAAARELANSLNIPTLSGITISSEDTSLAIKQCESIGYPLMLKATGAGGGRAMRKVHQESDFIGALSQVKN